MKRFVVIATKRITMLHAFCEITARIEVEAGTLHEAYRYVRKSFPELKHAYLRPE